MRVSAKSGSSKTNFPTIFGSSDGICRITSCHVPDHRRVSAADGEIVLHDRRATIMRGEAATAMFDRRMETNDMSVRRGEVSEKTRRRDALELLKTAQTYPGQNN